LDSGKAAEAKRMLTDLLTWQQPDYYWLRAMRVADEGTGEWGVAKRLITASQEFTSLPKSARAAKPQCFSSRTANLYLRLLKAEAGIILASKDEGLTAEEFFSKTICVHRASSQWSADSLEEAELKRLQIDLPSMAQSLRARFLSMAAPMKRYLAPDSGLLGRASAAQGLGFFAQVMRSEGTSDEADAALADAIGAAQTLLGDDAAEWKERDALLRGLGWVGHSCLIAQQESARGWAQKISAGGLKMIARWRGEHKGGEAEALDQLVVMFEKMAANAGDGSAPSQ
jgi:hypothetical protein